jgi:antitoxin CptB
MDESDRIRRLRWLCRRGMKELDILLESFLDAQAGPLSQGSWPCFESLLGIEDDLLWDWIQDPSQAADKTQLELLQAIRETQHA